MSVLDTIKKVKEQSKKRKFNQSMDIVINLKNVNLKKQENKFTADFQFPYAVSNKRIGVIGEVITKKAKDADELINKSKLQELIKDKKKAKEFFNTLDFLIAEAPLMPTIAKEFGIILGPRNMMPKPLPIQEDPSNMINALKKTITIKLKDAAIIQCKIGHEKMENNQIKENAETLLSFIRGKLPKGNNNIKDIRLKLTMGAPIKVK